jgi:hypothetical protein
MHFMAYGGSGILEMETHFQAASCLCGLLLMPVWPPPHAAAAHLRVVLRCAHMHCLCASDFAAVDWSCPHALPFNLLAGPLQDRQQAAQRARKRIPCVALGQPRQPHE